MLRNRESHLWGLALLLCTVALMCLPNLASADPRQWGDDGVYLRQGHHIEWQRGSYRNNDGYTLVVWSDTRLGDRDTYGQLISPTGQQMWDASGQPLIVFPYRQEDPEVVATSDNGWLVAWIDFRYDSTGDVMALKYNMSGNVFAGWDPEGVIVDTLQPNASVLETTVRAVSDGAGGAIIAWEDTRLGDGDIFAQRMTSNGTKNWAQTLSVTDTTGVQSGITADTDGQGNMILAWQDNRNPSDQDIYAAKITLLGTLPWGPHGTPVCNATGQQQGVKVCSDLSVNGAYFAWVDARIPATKDLYIQRFNSFGEPQWDVNGILLCGAPNDQLGVRVAASINGGTQDGCITTWEDQRVNSATNEVYAQKTLANGTHVWSDNGLFVCGNANPDGSGESRDAPRQTTDGSGGSILCWDDTRDVAGYVLGYDLYAARINAAGSMVWGECGIMVCAEVNQQFSGVIRMNNDYSRATIFYDDTQYGSQTIRVVQLYTTTGARVNNDCGDAIVFGLDGDATKPKSIDMTMGRVAVVWEDNRGGSNGTALFYQIMDTVNGTFQFEQNGDTLCPDNGTFARYEQHNQVLCSDGHQGFFVAFEDSRESIGRVRLTHVDRNGTAIGPRDGMVVWHTGINEQREVLITPDGSGGCYVAWSGFNDLLYLDVFVMRMNSDCEPMWDEPVILTNIEELVDDNLHSLTSNPDGCCIAVWQTGTFVGYDLITARVCGDGSVSWNQPLCDAVNVQSDGAVVADGEGGAYYAWSDERNPNTNKDVFAQHITAAGTETWTNNGVLVISADLLQKVPTVIVDSSNNAYVIWQDFRNGADLDLYVQKLNPAGVRQWEVSGRPIAVQPGDQNEVVARMEWGEGFYAAWTDGRNIFTDIYSTHFDENGALAEPYWQASSGGIICDFYQHQSAPTMADDGHGGNIVTWVDWRSSGKEPLQNLWSNWVNDYTVSVDEVRGAPLPKQYSLEQNFPNPFNPTTEFQFSVLNTERVQIRVFNTVGQQVAVLVDKMMTAGTYSVDFDAKRLASGIYFYRLETPNFQTVRKMTLIR